MTKSRLSRLTSALEKASARGETTEEGEVAAGDATTALGASILEAMRKAKQEEEGA